MIKMYVCSYIAVCFALALTSIWLQCKRHIKEIGNTDIIIKWTMVGIYSVITIGTLVQGQRLISVLRKHYPLFLESVNKQINIVIYLVSAFSFLRVMGKTILVTFREPLGEWLAQSKLNSDWGFPLFMFGFYLFDDILPHLAMIYSLRFGMINRIRVLHASNKVEIARRTSGITMKTLRTSS